MTHNDCEQKWNETREEPKKTYCVKGCYELKSESDEEEPAKCVRESEYKICKSKSIQSKRL